MNGFELDICIAVLVWVISLVIFFSLYITNLCSPMDEGFNLCPAQRINRGEFPYKDIFVGTYTPAKAYMTALFLRIFGESLRSARIYWTMSVSLFPPLLYILSRQAGASWPFSISAPVLFWILMFPPRECSHPIFVDTGRGSDRLIPALLFFIWGMAFPAENSTYGLIWGVLLGISWMWGQEVAFFSVCAAIGLKGVDIIHSVFSLGMGAVLVIIPSYLYFLVHKVRFKDILYQDILILFNVKRRVLIRLPYPSLYTNFFSIPWSPRDPFWRNGIKSTLFMVNFYLPFLFIGGGVVKLFIDGVAPGPLMGFLFFCIPSLLVIRERADYFHVVHVLIPCLVLASLLLEDFVFFFLDQSGLLSYLLLYVLFIMVCWLAYCIYQSVRTVLAEFFNREGRVMLSIDRGQVRVQEEYGKSAEKIVPWLLENTRSDERILVIPHDPLIYFLSDRRAPGKIYAVLAFKDNDELEEIVSDMKREGIRYVVKNKNWFEVSQDNRSHFSTYAGLLHEYVQNHYRLLCSFGMYEVLEKVGENAK